ncbi:MAG TPA: cytochrome c-type biogenesis protein [Rhodocyclaceae bacterium]|nr:cytochrome c-type biogenesis protein [Rhodocyclaceae bacterium]
MKRLLVFLLALFACGVLLAKEAAPLAEDEAVEKRMIGITEDLRCLVCQNESLAGSHADLAEDLRREVRGLIKQGKSDQEIKDYLVDRYGDFVLYKPPVKATTWLLWGGPFLFMIGGVAALVFYLRRRGRRVAEAHLSDDERRQAEDLLKEENPS